MSLPLPDTGEHKLGLRAGLSVLEQNQNWDVCALGPGLARSGATDALVRRLVADLMMPLVLDADGLNAAARYDDCLHVRTSPTVLTPHPGEMARLAGCSIRDVQDDREKKAEDYAQRVGAVVVLKGYRTVVTDGENTWINPTGNPGMATGGMGDVLTGLIAGLIGQGMNVWEAVRLGVFVHGRAGDVAAERTGQLSLSPESLMDLIPEVWGELRDIS
jgi:NAD(P)H-hydrate epimerase